MLLLQGQGCGVDVESVENLIRRHEEMEREARVIQERGAVSRLDSCNTKNTFIHINQCTVGSTSYTISIVCAGFVVKGFIEKLSAPSNEVTAVSTKAFK